MSRALTREDLALISDVAPRFRKAANPTAGVLLVLGLVIGFSVWDLQGMETGRVLVGALGLAALGRLAVMPYGCLLYLRRRGIKLGVSELDVLMAQED